jgi:hypothetical protein
MVLLRLSRKSVHRTAPVGFLPLVSLANFLDCYSCTIFSDMVCRLLSEWCVAASFYQRTAILVFLFAELIVPYRVFPGLPTRCLRQSGAGAEISAALACLTARRENPERCPPFPAASSKTLFLRQQNPLRSSAARDPPSWALIRSKGFPSGPAPRPPDWIPGARFCTRPRNARSY